MRDNAEIFSLLHRAGQIADEIFASYVAELTPRQYLVLSAIAELGDGVNQRAISAHTGIDRSTVSEVVRRLMKRGYVLRPRSGEDARNYSIRLTSSGREMLAAAKQVARMAATAFFNTLPGEHRVPLISALEALTGANVQQMQEAA